MIKKIVGGKFIYYNPLHQKWFTVTLPEIGGFRCQMNRIWKRNQQKNYKDDPAKALAFLEELGDFESLEEAKEKISLVDTYQTLLVQQEVNTLFTSVSDKLVEGSEQDAKAYIRSLVSIGADGLQKPEKILDKFKEEKAYMLKPEKETLPNTPDRRKRDDKKVDYRLKI